MTTALTRASTAVAAAALIAASGIAFAAPAAAADVTVTTGQQLIDAIVLANGDPAADTITVSGGPIVLPTDLPTITSPLTITGPGVTIDGDTHAGFTVFSSALTLNGFTISDVEDAIYSENSTLVVSDVSVTDGLGPVVDYGIYVSTGDVTVTDSAFTGARYNYIYSDDDDVVLLQDTSFDDSFYYGLQLEADDEASLTLNRVTANESSDGIGVSVFDDVTVLVTDSSATGNEGTGLSIYSDSSMPALIANFAADGNGSGIYAETSSDSAAINFINATVRNSNDSDAVDAYAYRGLISFTNSWIVDNETGGMYVYADAGTVLVSNTTVAGNGVDSNVWLGGIYADVNTKGTVLIDSTTISGNEGEDAGGLHAEFFYGGLVIVTNSTIVGNSAEAGGAIQADTDGEGDASGILSVSHSTITGNMSDSDEGEVTISGIDATISHTIIAGNTGDGAAHDLGVSENATLAIDYSLVQVPNTDATAALTGGTGNIVGLDPQLGPLANNGGPTLTQLPNTGSRVINTGNPAIVGAPATDQRGSQRIVNVIDIGAVEVAAVPLPATGAVLDPAVPLGAALLLLAGLALAVTSRITRRGLPQS